MHEFLKILTDTWLEYNDCAQFLLASIAVLLNTILIFLIVTKSPKVIGNYKFLMIYIAVFEITYSIFGLVIRPLVHSFNTRVIIFQEVKTNKSIDLMLIAIYAGFYACSIALFAIHFFYRYGAMNKLEKFRYFEGRKLTFWMVLPILYMALWSCSAYYIFPEDSEYSEVIRRQIREVYNLDIDKVAYVGEYLFAENSRGEIRIGGLQIFGTILQFLMIGSSVFTVFYFGIKSFLSIRKPRNTTSDNTRRMQNQFFNALVIQTLIPLVLMYIPILIAFSCAMTFQNIGNTSGIVSIGMALYPAVDPLPTLLIIRYYRDAIREKCACTTKVESFNVLDNGRTGSISLRQRA